MIAIPANEIVIPTILMLSVMATGLDGSVRARASSLSWKRKLE